LHSCELSGTKPRSFVPQKYAAGFYFAPSDVTLERKVEQIRNTIITAGAGDGGKGGSSSWAGHLGTHADREVAELEGTPSPVSPPVGGTPPKLRTAAEATAGDNDVAALPSRGVGAQLAELNATVRQLLGGLAALNQRVEAVAAEGMQRQAESHAALFAAMQAGFEAKRRRTHGTHAAGDTQSPSKHAITALAVADGGTPGVHDGGSYGVHDGSSPSACNGGGTPGAHSNGGTPGAHNCACGAYTACEGELGEEPAPRSTAKQKSRPHRAQMGAQMGATAHFAAHSCAA